MLKPGDPAPHFTCASSVNPRFSFDTVAGRYVVLSFFGSLDYGPAQRFLTAIVARGDRFDVRNAIFFGVTIDRQDTDRIRHESPGRVYFYDTDLAVSRLYGVASIDMPHAPALAGKSPTTYQARTYVLDQALRVVAVIGMGDDVEKQIDSIFAVLDAMPAVHTLPTAAPVLIVPYVLEPGLCEQLIRYYETNGGFDSGFMRDVDGKTVGITDYQHKRRMDCEITDQPLIRTLHERLQRRVVPAIQQAYQFTANRIERHIVACYDSAQGAHFRAHRDNTTLGTAHRRFAITINLNSPDYDGGEIWFPEFGPRKYKAPSGAAIVFSCSLLHEVPPVTRGVRYAFLPFMYDDAAAQLRERNRKHLGDVTGATGRASGVTVADCSAVAGPRGARASATPVLDGHTGCGNPDGCGTCLTAATYQIDTSAIGSNAGAT